MNNLKFDVSDLFSPTLVHFHIAVTKMTDAAKKTNVFPVSRTGN